MEVRDPLAAQTVGNMFDDFLHGRDAKFFDSLAGVLEVKKGAVPALEKSAERALKALSELGALKEEDVTRVAEYDRAKKERRKR